MGSGAGSGLSERDSDSEDELELGGDGEGRPEVQAIAAVVDALEALGEEGMEAWWVATPPVCARA